MFADLTSSLLERRLCGSSDVIRVAAKDRFLELGVERRKTAFGIVLLLTEEVDMRKHVFALTASAVVFAFGVLVPIAQAQAPAVPAPGSQQRPAGNQDGGGMMGRGGMMGGGMMGREGMMDSGMMGGGMMGQGRAGGMAPMMMRIMFILMDANGDGKLSLQEFQAAHERIFKAMDANKDGFVTFEERQEFMHGTSGPGPQQQ